MFLREFTYADLIERNARDCPDRMAFVSESVRMTHGEFARRVARTASVLQQAGVGVGDRVAILARNGLAYVEITGAVAWLGAILVPINWRLSSEEVAFIIADAEPVVVIADDTHAMLAGGHVAQFASPTLHLGIGAESSFAAPFVSLARAVENAGAAPRAALPARASFLMFYTAAVDGKPRGAMISHAGVIAGSAQLIACWSLTPKDVNLGLLPLFHLAGMAILVATQHAGGQTLLMEKFEPVEVVQAIREERVTLFGEFAPMLGKVLDAATSADDLRSLRLVSGLDSPETVERFQRRCSGAKFWSVYGQSETSGLISTAAFDERPGSAGRPMILSNVAIVDALDRVQPKGTVGEIVVRGEVVFNGYWRREQENEATFRNGWHHTGDNGLLDEDGYLWYKGRTPAKELIKSGGENVYPTEVEEAIRAHPAVLESVVFGIPDAEWGEAIKAICVRRPGMSIESEELVQFIAARLARYKRPRKLIFVDALPKSAEGKIDRIQVKEVWREG